MDNSFWLKRWENGEIGFHESEVNPFLLKYSNSILKKDDRVFIPLCGKSLDISYILSKGCFVIGCELSKLAIKELFYNLKIIPNIIRTDYHIIYEGDNIKIFVGDFFHLLSKDLGDIDVIYDRGALVALPFEVRIKYSKYIQNITKSAKQLLVVYNYDQSLKEGTPYSIKKEELLNLYKEYSSIRLLDSICVEGGLKGKCEAYEEFWLLS